MDALEQARINTDHEHRITCLENCVQNLLDWQRTQNGTLRTLDEKLDQLLLREASRDGSIRTLKWLAALVGVAGIANLVSMIVKAVGG
jgi:hypothetical protein